MIFGLNPIQFIIGLSLIFFIVPSIVFLRVVDPRSNYEVETVQLYKGFNVHRQCKIDGLKTERVTQYGLKIRSDSVYRDALKKRKYLYYLLFGFRGRLMSFYLGDLPDPIMFEDPAVPANILKTAKHSDAIKKGIDKQFKQKASWKTIMILMVAAILVFVIISYFQAGGTLV